jgi:cell division protein ZipA
MEITTILGIVVAVVIMLLGIRMIMKKPADAAPSLDSELHIDPDSQTPVIPRHVRAQLSAQEAEAQRVEPSLNAETVESIAPATEPKETAKSRADIDGNSQACSKICKPAGYANRSRG